MTNITNIDRTPFTPPAESHDDPCDEVGAPFWQNVPQPDPSPQVIKITVQSDKNSAPIVTLFAIAFWVILGLAVGVLLVM